MPAMTLDDVLEAFERDAVSHTTGGPASEQDLKHLEAALGRPLPPSLRAFLARVGAGLFYQGHEIFGPQRVMIHDIELVPSLPSILARLRQQDLPEGLIPFHRGNGVFHLLDTRGGDAGRVVSLPSGSSYSDLSSFLQQVVLPR
jgi:hypothetical protein